MTTWLSLDEAAEYLKMDRSTLYRLAREGQMPGHKRGRVRRFDAAGLDAWMKQGDNAPSDDGPSAPGSEAKP